MNEQAMEPTRKPPPPAKVQWDDGGHVEGTGVSDSGRHFEREGLGLGLVCAPVTPAALLWTRTALAPA
jgi:hypothetical protein